jgi:hypothetical protein
MNSAPATDIKWTRRRAGFYTATVARPDLGVNIYLTVEQGDRHNADQRDIGWWNFGTSHSGSAADNDCTPYDYGTMAEAKRRAEGFALNARIDPKWGLVS